MSPFRLTLCLCLTLAGGLLAPVLAQETRSRSETEARLEALKSEISALQASLEDARSAFSSEQKAVRNVDLEIQAKARELQSLNQEQSEKEAELQTLEAERTQYLESLKDRKDALSTQIVAAYQIGRESRLKMLLNQDNPARIGRMLAYYDYISQAQVEKIEGLRTALQQLDTLQTRIDAALLQLMTVRNEVEAEAMLLQESRNRRAALIEKLAGAIERNEARLSELSQNRRDLETLLTKLDEAFSDIPSELGAYRSIAQLKGALPMPLAGRVQHAFGQSRMGGLSWQGWLIAAESGTEARSIAYGRVAYADWLRGYGLLMIIDHGDGFMSLYGNNESLLFDVGDWVQAGTVVSIVGASPGSGQGLYFELRAQGKAVDPAIWVKR